MYEKDMIRLREQKEFAEEALSGVITDEQRERLTDVIRAIDAEIKNSPNMERSAILPRGKDICEK